MSIDRIEMPFKIHIYLPNLCFRKCLQNRFSGQNCVCIFMRTISWCGMLSQSLVVRSFVHHSNRFYFLYLSIYLPLSFLLKCARQPGLVGFSHSMYATYDVFVDALSLAAFTFIIIGRNSVCGNHKRITRSSNLAVFGFCRRACVHDVR